MWQYGQVAHYSKPLKRPPPLFANCSILRTIQKHWRKSYHITFWAIRFFLHMNTNCKLDLIFNAHWLNRTDLPLITLKLCSIMQGLKVILGKNFPLFQYTNNKSVFDIYMYIRVFVHIQIHE